MRRIYESDALSRDEDNPFQPNKRERSSAPAASRTLPAKTLSRILVPDRLLYRGLSVSIATPQSVYDAGDAVPISVSIENAFPFPVSVTAESSLLWRWAVDGAESASHVDDADETQSRVFWFGRSETKRFTRRWHQMFQVTETEWEPADTGEHIIRAALNVSAPGDRLRDETTIRIR